MTHEEAREILSAYRPGLDDEADPTFAEALRMARSDAELGAWLEQSVAFDHSVRRALSGVKAPSALRQALLAGQKIVRPAPWWNPRLTARQMAAAAAFVAAVSLAALWFAQRPASFAEFRRDIVEQSWGSVPHVELKAASLGDVREILGARHFPTNFAVPSVLARLKVRGLTLVRWQGREVPVICFNAEGAHLHLAVTDRSLFPDAPTEIPQTDQWESWRTASWSKDESSYVLTGLNTTTFVKKFRKDRRWDWGG